MPQRIVSCEGEVKVMTRQMFVWSMREGLVLVSRVRTPLAMERTHASIGRSVILSRDLLIIQGLWTMCSMNCPIVA